MTQVPHRIETVISQPDAPPPPVVPPRSPTVLRPLSLTFSDMSFDDMPSPVEKDTYQERHEGEASRYLAHFHDGTWNDSQTGLCRVRPNRVSVATDMSELPSLIHSPSSSVASLASLTQSRPRPSRHNKSYSAYATPATDLVTPCQAEEVPSPTQLLQASSVKSSASTVTSLHHVEGRSGRSGSPPGRLDTPKQLFSHEAMKAPPKYA
jgi:hypothetical protein